MTTLPTESTRRPSGRQAFRLAAVACAGAILAALLSFAPAIGRPAVTERWLSTANPDIRLQLFRPGDPAPRAGFPVILFNPGWRSPLDAYETHLTRLARGGYVVLGVERSAASMAWQGDLDLSSDEAFAATIERADRATRVGAEDMSRLLDALSEGGIAGTPLDLDRIALSGHSFGGTIALQGALTDPRVRAAINIDGWHFAEAATKLVPRPVLVLTDTAERPPAEDLSAADPVRRHEAALNAVNADWIALQSARPDAEIVAIAGAGHGAYIAKGGWRGLVVRGATLLGLRRDVAGLSDRALQDFLARHL